MRKTCLTVALALIACLGYAQDEKGALTSFYEKNTVLNFNDGIKSYDPKTTTFTATFTAIFYAICWVICLFKSVLLILLYLYYSD